MADSRQHGFWKYEHFDRNIEPEILPGFEDLVRLWRKKRGDRPVPAWCDFDYRDFVGWHGRIVVSEISYDPFDYRFRLFGEEVAKRLKVDYTGKTGSELVDCGHETAEDMAFYEMASRKMLITRVSGELYWLGRPHISATFAEFPLSDTGELTTHFLAAMI